MTGMGSEHVSQLMRKYLSPELPLGPVDTDNIAEPECSARLYDWQNIAFADLLKGSHVIIGRRGSGKSALLKMIRDAKLLEAARSAGARHGGGPPLRELSSQADFVLEVDLPSQVMDMELQFSSLKVAPFVEVIAQHWSNRIFFLIGDLIRQQAPALWARLPVPAQRYITAQDLIELDPADQAAVLSVREFADSIRRFLVEQKKKVIITFDSLEEYRFDGSQNMILAGLFRCAGQFLAQQTSAVDLKFCLPAELYPAIRHSVLNPDKDLTRKQFLHWNATELAHMAAHRLKVYLELFNPEEYEAVKGMRLQDREHLHAFWDLFLPRTVTNRLGAKEDSFRYILRHTQMLPRQLIMILNVVFNNALSAENRRKITEADVIRGVQLNEPTFRDTIVKMFEPQYPEIELVLHKVLPRLPRVFPYGTFQRIWREEARDTMAGMQLPDFWQFLRLMLSTGSVGVVERDQASARYVVGTFEFNTVHELLVSDKDELCVHPIFSRIYNCETPEGVRVVLPRGSYDGLAPA